MAVDTRRDIESSINIINGYILDIDSSINIFQNKYRVYKDLPSFIEVSSDHSSINIDLLSQVSINGLPEVNTDNISSLEVTDNLPECRIGIFTDPIWNYEPFTLKNSVSTLLDRYFLDYKITLIYSGSPRANWDIKHFAGVYRIPPHRSIEVPFNWVPANPLLNKDSMIRFIRVLFEYDRKNNKMVKIDKVIIFSNNPYAHNSTYINPLIRACTDHNIPFTVITSKGDILGSDPASGRLITRQTLDPNMPIDQQPHWGIGMGSKHRDVFDDHKII